MAGKLLAAWEVEKQAKVEKRRQEKEMKRLQEAQAGAEDSDVDDNDVADLGADDEGSHLSRSSSRSSAASATTTPMSDAPRYQPRKRARPKGPRQKSLPQAFETAGDF